ncbi:MAG: glycoside hydrolase family 15 protein [Gammaproteobacteria bacterium]
MPGTFKQENTGSLPQFEGPLPPEEYPAISDYALIGDCRIAALISRDGAVEWLCLPHFSGDSIFAAILDRQRGGYFSLRPAQAYTVSRRYISGSNVLESIFRTNSGEIRLIDCVPILTDTKFTSQLQPQRELLRTIEGISGHVDLQLEFQPRPSYGQKRIHIRERGRLGWACKFGNQEVYLRSAIPLHKNGDDMLRGEVTVAAGDRFDFSLNYTRHNINVLTPLGSESQKRQQATVDWWRSWLQQMSYQGAYHEHIERSILTLKLLTYGLSGALIAGPSSSLPGKIGGVRNWDYRYCWIRDAALTLTSFIDLGFIAEGEAFLGWMLHATRRTWPKLRVAYDVYGETHLHEREFRGLEGYRQSLPIRLGNAAGEQHQLDVYGEVIASAYEYVLRGGKLDRSEARLLKGFGRMICEFWRKPDQGIWEARDAPRHYTHSKLMCWVGLDRLLVMAKTGIVHVDMQKIEAERDAIAEFIETRCFDTESGTFMTAADCNEVDASILLLARHGFIDATDPRMRATYDRIQKVLGAGALLMRFPEGFDDFLPPGEGAFLITSFWAVEYLVLAGEIDAARERFETLLGYANDLDLYAEEADPENGMALGNFPQAFSHTGLINAALLLAEAEQKEVTK